MKRVLLIFAVILGSFFLIYSCFDAFPPVTKRTNKFLSNKVTIEDIDHYLSSFKGLKDTKSGSLSVEPILFDNDTVMYLVNYADGWEVLSADRRVSKVLIYSNSGNISLEELTENLSGNDFFYNLSEGMRMIINEDTFEGIDTLFSDSWEGSYGSGDRGQINTRIVKVLLNTTTLNLVTQTKDHLMSTRWGQGYPWNQYSPFKDSTKTECCYAGCVPVAIAQAAYYLHNKIGVPQYTYGDAFCEAFIPSSCDSIVLQPGDVWFSSYSASHWSDMPLDAAVTSGADKVSALLLRIGYLIAARYKRDATSAYIGWIYYPLEHLNISSETDSITSLAFLSSTIKSDVYDNELPVLLSIEDTVRRKGHCVVVDGYKYIKNQITSYYAYYITGDDGLILLGQQPDSYGTVVSEEESYFAAVNWGWDGSYDSTSLGTIWYNLADDWIVSTRNYSRKRKIIHNLSALSN